MALDIEIFLRVQVRIWTTVVDYDVAVYSYWAVRSHRIRGRCLVPRPGNVVPIRGSGSKRVSVPFKIGSCPGLKGVAAPLLADLIGIRRLRIVDWCDFC